MTEVDRTVELDNSVSVAGLLEHAEAICEARMKAIAEGKSGRPLPAAWFAYHQVVKTLKPLKHTAHHAETTRIS